MIDVGDTRIPKETIIDALTNATIHNHNFTIGEWAEFDAERFGKIANLIRRELKGKVKP